MLKTATSSARNTPLKKINRYSSDRIIPRSSRFILANPFQSFAMKKVILLLMVFSLMTVSCTDRDDDLTSVNIRIKNSSTVVFDEVLVSDEEHIYENQAPDSFSEYQEFEMAYRYAYIRITSGEETYELQPIDFVGEEELPIGLYTYDLSLTEEGEVILEFIID